MIYQSNLTRKHPFIATQPPVLVLFVLVPPRLSNTISLTVPCMCLPLSNVPRTDSYSLLSFSPMLWSRRRQWRSSPGCTTSIHSKVIPVYLQSNYLWTIHTHVPHFGLECSQFHQPLCGLVSVTLGSVGSRCVCSHTLSILTLNFLPGFRLLEASRHTSWSNRTHLCSFGLYRRLLPALCAGGPLTFACPPATPLS
jgi:hypothetical protein